MINVTRKTITHIELEPYDTVVLKTYLQELARVKPENFSKAELKVLTDLEARL